LTERYYRERGKADRARADDDGVGLPIFNFGTRTTRRDYRVTRSSKFRRQDFRLNGPNNVLRDLISKIKDVCERTIKPFRPDTPTRFGLNQLATDAHSVVRFTDAAFEHISERQAHARPA